VIAEKSKTLKTTMVKAGHLGRMRGAETNRKNKQEIIDYFIENAKKDIK